MSAITITIEGIEELQRKANNLLPQINAGLNAGAIYVKGQAAMYPAQTHATRASVYGKTFQSDRQRRWFFAVGIHQTPYGRTSQLGQGWFVNNRDMLSVAVENATEYGYYVQGAPGQSLYHRAQGWKDTNQVAEESGPVVTNMLKKMIDNL